MRKVRLLLRKFLQGLRSFVTESSLDPLPIRHGFHGYNTGKLKDDLSAGTNVALLAFPQGMAYAVIAGLPIQYGIISGAVAAIVSPLFAGSRHTILGPTNATAFMLFTAYTVSDREGMLPLLLLMIGIMLTVGALLRVADLIQYISRSVVVGYITGAAILIIVNQLKPVMGISFLEDESPKTFFTILSATLKHAPETQWQPVVLGVVTLLVWLGLSLKFSRLPVFAITLVIMSSLYAVLREYAGFDVATFGAFTLEDLKPKMPRFSEAGAFADISQLFGVAFSIAFLAALENSVMSKSLASRVGDRPDPNQDMLSVGAANLAVTFAGGMPASGSLTRSALNFTSGAVTRLSSIVCGALCIGGLMVLGGTMVYVPKCCLAVLVMCIAGSVINGRNIRIALRSTPSDAAVLITTFLASLLLPLHIAIFLGVGISIALYLHAASQPFLTEYEFSEKGELREAGEKRERPIPAISIVHVEGELFFGAAELFRTQIQKTCADPDLKVIILRLKNARHLDATSVMALEEMVNFLNERDRHVIISGASKEVYRVLKYSGVADTLKRENIFLNSPKRPNLSTRKALKRAQEVLGTTEADIRIFFDPNKSKES